MPNPKRRHSKARTAKRRAHDFLTTPSPSTCQHCGEPKLPHRVCLICGKYGEAGREVVEVDDE